MPSVGMRRTTRVFGVVKGGDTARVLRSGRRLWPDSEEGKTRRGNEGGEECGAEKPEKDGGGDVGMADGGDGNDDSIGLLEMVKQRNRRALCLSDGENGRDRFYGIVYGRKRKRINGGAASSELVKGRHGNRKMFGLQFSRRQRRRKEPPRPVLTAVLKPCSGDIGDLFSCFLFHVLRQATRFSFTLKELSAFVLSEPISSAYASRGIQFSQGSVTAKVGVCRIFGTRRFMPLFCVDFSAVPLCFKYLHSGILLKSMIRSSFLVYDPVPSDVEEEIDLSDIQIEVRIPCNSFKRDASESGTIIPQVIEISDGLSLDSSVRKSSRLADRNRQFKKSTQKRRVKSLKKRKTRSKSSGALASGSRHGRTKSVAGPASNKKLRTFSNDTNNVSISEADTTMADSIEGLNSSYCSANTLISEADRSALASKRGQKKSVASAASNKKLRTLSNCSNNASLSEADTTMADLKEGLNSSYCSANILISEADRCYRVEGAVVTSEELSASGGWLLVVKKDGLTRCTLRAEKVMRPWYSNRYTHVRMFPLDNGWKLEFVNHQDWVVFKNLYKECSDHNIPAPVVKFIPVPGVRDVSGYADSCSVPFDRPSTYISANGDELSRAMARKTANYDMDSEDEEWLSKFNNEFQEHVSEDNFELIIDALEKAYYYNPDDCYDEKYVANWCQDRVSKEVVEAVHCYWMRKRKQKCSSLLRVFQCHQSKRHPFIPKPFLRKKRSFKRQPSQHGRDKQPSILQVAAEQDAVESKNAMLKVEAAQASANEWREIAVQKRKMAQLLMEKADLAMYKATMLVRVAEAASSQAGGDVE